MFDIDAEQVRQDCIVDKVKALELIGFQVAELLRIKEALEKQVCELIGHDKEGQQTYLFERYKVTCKTGVNYSLNKEEFEVVGKRLPACFNPVSVVQKYELNKKIIREAYLYGSAQDKKILDSIIVAKPAKLSVVIGAAS